MGLAPKLLASDEEFLDTRLVRAFTAVS